MKNDVLFIGIDLGTTAVKIIAVNGDGKVMKTVSKEYPISYPSPNWSEQNPEDWWEKTLLGLKELLEVIDKESIKGIGFSGQMHGLVTLDENDRVLRPAILWNDQRTEAECEYLNHEIGLDKLHKHVGNRALTGFTAPKILWMKKHEPELFKRIEKIMLPKDYLAYRLTGVFATDVSDASGTLYLDVANRQWSKWMMNLMNVQEKQLPKLYESYQSIGHIKKEFAEDLGLRADVKVIIGGGDQAVAAVGGGVVEDRKGTLSLGTSGVVFVSSDGFFADEACRLHSFCHANGKYHMMGVTLSAAQSLKWWMESVHESDDFDGSLQEAEKAAISNAIYFLPYLMGERSPHNDPHCRGAFIGLSMGHKKRDFTRAVLEGVAFSLRDTLEIMKAQGIEIEALKLNGGGAKSPFWCQIMADVMGVPVEKLEVDEGPAYGAAILAAVGSTYFETVEDACKAWIKMGVKYIPKEKNVQHYHRKYQTYKALYPMLKTLECL